MSNSITILSFVKFLKSVDNAEMESKKLKMRRSARLGFRNG